MPARAHGLLVVALLICLAGCGGDTAGTMQAPSSPSDDPAPEARTGTFSVVAAIETTPVPHDRDAADDPAIWVHPTVPEMSLIIGTDKQEGGGLIIYDLAGRQVGFQADGAINNVDVRGDVVVAGNEAENTVAIYRLDPAGPRLVPIASRSISPGITIYGTCLYQSATTGTVYAFLTSERGEIEQWRLVEAADGRYDARLVRSLELDSQTEACVADDSSGTVYFAEESTGIWRFRAEPTGGTKGDLIDGTGGDGHLTADVEGLAIAAYPDGGGLLIASSQGNDHFVVYSRQDNAYLATFTIGASEDIDGVSNTDGIEVTSASLGGTFSGGLLVVQDGKNDGNQNFKLVALSELLE